MLATERAHVLPSAAEQARSAVVRVCNAATALSEAAGAARAHAAECGVLGALARRIGRVADGAWVRAG